MVNFIEQKTDVFIEVNHSFCYRETSDKGMKRKSKSKSRFLCQEYRLERAGDVGACLHRWLEEVALHVNSICESHLNIDRNIFCLLFL